MAEYMMKQIVKDRQRETEFEISSASTGTEEIGSPVYPPARRKLAEHGITCSGHAARQLRHADYRYYDLLIGMDSYNIRNMQRICGGDPDKKIHRLLDFTSQPRDILDPWYTDDFTATWNDCLAGINALLNQL